MKAEWYRGELITEMVVKGAGDREHFLLLNSYQELFQCLKVKAGSETGKESWLSPGWAARKLSLEDATQPLVTVTHCHMPNHPNLVT